MKKKIFKVLFWFRINNGSHSLETQIQVVRLTTKYESPVMVIYQLQCLGTTNIPERHAVTLIHQKFFGTGPVGDRPHIGRLLLKMKQSIDKTSFKHFYPILQRKRLNNKTILQQDSTSPHFSKKVRT